LPPKRVLRDMTAPSTAATPRSRTDIIGRLNDRCRMGLDRTARTVITANCLATISKDGPMGEVVAQAGVLAAARKMTFLQREGCERDRGSFEYAGHTVYFAIDAYDLDLKYGSDDPADASVTRRVMTLMVRRDL